MQLSENSGFVEHRFFPAERSLTDKDPLTPNGLLMKAFALTIGL